MWRHRLAPNSSTDGSLGLSPSLDPGLSPGPGPGPGPSPGLGLGLNPLQVAPCRAARVRASVPAARELLRLAAAAPYATQGSNPRRANP